ncbi:YggS family pyridoxal phosphate-dependent enzyme [Flaviflagellibacter deserti]|uniref:Pyridoxal phosphate homeostasis protein n=1 Tax=Flaviflagellibacter deserti TaxID=2267266 RepID=A0ABV9Z7E8_9HYPH
MTNDNGQNGAAERLNDVRNAIARAAKSARREATDVILVAVSKTFDAEHIEPVLQAGQTVFGENRVQEAAEKWPALRAKYPDTKVHLIGPLQSNKAREAVTLFDVIHSVDRRKIAETLMAEMEKQKRFLPVFLQINTGEEPQKAGVAPLEADAFIAFCRDLGLTVEGLMCIPPAEENPAPHFALLEKIARRNGLKGLSMGMSGDFETAIAHGATYVRVGSAIFGAR